MGTSEINTKFFRRCSVKTVLLFFFANFPRKHSYWSVFLTKLQAWDLQLYYKETSAQVFSCRFAKFLRMSFLWSTSSGCFWYFINFSSLFVLTSLPTHKWIHKMIRCEKRKIKYTSIFYLYLKEVRLIKKAGLEPYSPC